MFCLFWFGLNWLGRGALSEAKKKEEEKNRRLSQQEGNGRRTRTTARESARKLDRMVAGYSVRLGNICRNFKK